MDNLLLKHLPFPPQANHRLMPANGRLIKSPDARHYDKMIEIWMLRQRSALYDNRRKAKEWIDTGFMLKIELYFFWQREKLIAKNGMPKKTDLDNRIKSQIDAISDILDIDDKFVIEIIAHKIPWIKSYEEVTAKITPCHWRSLDDC